MARSGVSVPNSSQMRAMTWVASSEWPPSSKKSSSVPTSVTSRPSAPAHMADTRCWATVAATVASRRWAGGLVPGRGSAARSTLPLAVSGNEATATKALGTMWSGRRSTRNRRSSLEGTAAPGVTT